MAEPVSTDVCMERMRIQDERFARDKERIQGLEQVCSELQRLTAQMSELLKKYDEELQDHREQLKAHDDRLTAIEQRPAKWWDKLVGTIITAVGSAIGGSLLTLLVQSISK